MNLINKITTCFFLFLGSTNLLHAQSKPIDLASPNGEIQVSVSLGDKIYYSIAGKKQELLNKNVAALSLKEGVLGANPKLVSSKKTKGTEVIKPYVSLKFATVNNSYNGAILTFKGNFPLEFRVFDDGVAYRFATSKKGDIEILDEQFALNFPSDYLLHVQQNNGFKTAYEENYQHIESNTWKPADKMANLPLLIDTKKQYKILISESDLSDYPALFLKGNGNNGLEGTFPKAPLEFAPDGDRSQKIIKSADYIAKTRGTRTFPWRYFVVTSDDRQLMKTP